MQSGGTWSHHREPTEVRSLGLHFPAKATHQALQQQYPEGQVDFAGGGPSESTNLHDPNDSFTAPVRL